MARKYDFDYNFDPDGTSLVTPDPYTQDVLDSPDVKAESSSSNHDGLKKSVYRNGHDDSSGSRRFATPTERRPRSKSPTPPPQTEPSPEYLTIASQQSLSFQDPKGRRKLLILDLNGTLVYRSPHQRRNPYQNPSAPRPLRPVHARPYLSSFRAYLFHPRVKEWLDTMVWSSAQPHSVGDMVQNCFGGKKDGLTAVWARDTLGLSQEDYFRKSQTTKDLAKPWAALADLGHSARTTLLLDDSPLKARLQPWNHLCIKDYVGEMRQVDVKVREAEVARELKERLEKQLATAGETSPKQDEEAPEEDDPKKRKRNKRKEKKELKRIERITTDVEGLTPLSEDGRPLEYDQTLLAVIGILDAVKHEDNVAGWMRSGGLVHVPLRANNHRSEDQRSRSGSPVALKKRRLSDESTLGSSEIEQEAEVVESTPSPPLREPSSSPQSSLLPAPSSPLVEAQATTGVPLLDSVEMPLSQDSQVGTGSQVAVGPLQSPGLWFDHPDSFRYWAHQGRQALQDLGIEIESGVIGSTG